MAKKQESISDKIIRLYKEGYSTAEIAKEMEMPAGNVPNILEKHWPDYQSYVQPERDPEAAQKKGSILPFGRKGKNDKPAVTGEPFAPSLNLAMDDDGFVDHSVAGIASMLNKGRSAKEVADFFGKDINDIKAVEQVMDEHFARLNEHKGPAVASTKKSAPKEAPKAEEQAAPAPEEPKPTPAEDKAASIASSIAKRNSSSTFETGAADASPVKVPEPVQEPEPMPVENNVPKPTEAPKAEEQITMDELQVPDLGYDDAEPEMPSIEPIALDDAFIVEPAPESTMPSIEEEMAKREEEAKQLEEEKKEITNFSKNMEEEIMSPQEKMRMFAQEQIEQNNKKIDELQLGIADKENKSIELGKQADEIYSQIIALQEKAKGFSSEKEKLDIEIGQVKGDIEGLKRENEEFKSFIK